ncbi:hypothetical protein IM697_00150 [Streptomyces ferrugineus]|uniref:Uncharacterized protein n=1 Tax=Streptomyces ferrugineus TaxID=1413221 RepID=A0A7M2SKY2_9ACTN|nr:hypothetical protein [Streptomyces ferrugineus]QOV36932.1 hypothetical protein IM697_00150 [Streptomyces ferrugineus]
MTARTAQRETLKVPDTGWTKARQLRRKTIRTCVAAVEDDRKSPPSAHTSAEWNIVRGED